MTYFLLRVTLVLLVLLSAISLFFPFLIRSDFRDSARGIPEIVLGFEYLSAFITIFLVAIGVLFIFNNVNRYLILVLIPLQLFSLYVLRVLIHFQGMIDHDFDTQTGVGYKLLFISVCAQVLVLILILFKKNVESRTNPNSTLD